MEALSAAFVHLGSSATVGAECDPVSRVPPSGRLLVHNFCFVPTWSQVT